MSPSPIRNKPEGLVQHLHRKYRIKRRFRNIYGHEGNFIWPQDYSEKIQYRKIWGNHAFYATVADKYRARDYIAKKIGEQYLIPLLGIYDQLKPDIFDKLPDQFFINANHGCGWYKIVRNKQELDIEATCNYFNRVVRQIYGRGSGEYHYSLIEPKILVLDLLTDEDRLPYDYNIFCYNSNKGFDYAITIARPGNDGAIHFDKNWNLIEGELRKGEEEKYIKPDNSSEMLHIARALSSDFDFARIDLYNIDGHIYFGEITVTPAAGFGGSIKNPARAEMRTKMWQLDADNRMLYRKPWVRRLQELITKTAYERRGRY